jgi:hypothetical protein
MPSFQVRASCFASRHWEPFPQRREEPLFVTPRKTQGVVMTATPSAECDGVTDVTDKSGNAGGMVSRFATPSVAAIMTAVEAENDDGGTRKNALYQPRRPNRKHSGGYGSLPAPPLRRSIRHRIERPSPRASPSWQRLKRRMTALPSLLSHYPPCGKNGGEIFRYAFGCDRDAGGGAYSPGCLLVGKDTVNPPRAVGLLAGLLLALDESLRNEDLLLVIHRSA